MRALSLLFSASLLLGCKASEAPVAPQVASTPAVSETTQLPAAPQILPAGRLEDIDFNSYSQEMAQAFGLELGETRLDSIDKIRLYFSPEPGTNMVNMLSLIHISEPTRPY